MNVDDAIAALREAIKADLYELLDTDAEPSYDEYHDGVEVILSLNEDDESKQDGKLVHIELYNPDSNNSEAVNLNMDDARRFHAALTAILKKVNS